MGLKQWRTRVGHRQDVIQPPETHQNSENVMPGAHTVQHSIAYCTADAHTSSISMAVTVTLRLVCHVVSNFILKLSS